MASGASNTSTDASTMNDNSPTYGSSDPTSPNTTFVQADPSTFRTIVQKLTGAPDSPSTQKFPITHPTRHATNTGPRRPAFKLHERRQSAKNLQINLNNNDDDDSCCHSKKNFEQQHPDHMFQLSRHRGSFLVSPVSPLDLLASSRMTSPSSPYEEELEERAIAEKGFYFHPSPLSTPRGADPPELLPLFPLTSPRLDNQEDDHHNGCSSSCS